MNENLSWLFAAFAIGWAIVFSYLYWIARKEERVGRRIDELERMLEKSRHG